MVVSFGPPLRKAFWRDKAISPAITSYLDQGTLNWHLPTSRFGAGVPWCLSVSGLVCPPLPHDLPPSRRFVAPVPLALFHASAFRTVDSQH